MQTGKKKIAVMISLDAIRLIIIEYYSGVSKELDAIGFGCDENRQTTLRTLQIFM
jgi:hypothetical protein